MVNDFISAEFDLKTFDYPLLFSKKLDGLNFQAFSRFQSQEQTWLLPKSA